DVVRATLTWHRPEAARVGEVFTMTLDMDTSAPLRGMPIQLRYDSDRLELIDIQEGEFFRRDGAKTSFTQVLRDQDGIARAGVLRNASTAATGRGTVYTLHVKALKTGSATLSLASANAVSLGPEVVVGIPAPEAIVIR